MNNGEYVEWKYRGWQFGAWKISSINPAPPSKVVIAFHGFDRKAKEMENFMPLYDSNTSMLSISLLHHGSSKPLPPIPLKEPLSPKLLIDAIESYIGLENVRLELLGYSMGARIALKLFQDFPDKFFRIISLAPDGLKMGRFYKFIVNTRIGRFTWGLVDKYPKINRFILDTSRSLRIISDHKHHFGRFHTDNPEIRKRVAYGWVGHKEFWPEENKLANVLTENVSSEKAVYFIFGNRDKIIPFSWSIPLQKKLKQLKSNDSNIKEIYFLKVPCGHVMRHPDIVELIKEKIWQTIG
jgi:pimeloyl-ACP methyl ester carboxylesterase